MYERFIRWFLNFYPVKLIILGSKKLIIPGFDGLPAYDVFTFFLKALYGGALNVRASSVAFNFILAIFPATIFFFTLIAYVPIEGFQDNLLGLMADILPPSSYETVRETIEDIIGRQRSGLLSIGFISALFFSTNGVNSLIDSFNKTKLDIESRSALVQRGYSAMITGILAFFILIAIALIIFGRYGVDILTEYEIITNQLSYIALNLSRWLVIIGLIFFAISVLYYFGPAKRTKWRFFSAGSTLATILTIVTSLSFSFFVERFGTYNKLYGSIGTLIVVMMWMYIMALVLLVGFELNISIENAKIKHQGEKDLSLNISIEDVIIKKKN
jgi:membrane protein